ncbi:hypothetical protein AXG93_2396s1350 [Marchantia polymorpha subsp. ruderalis]|uniref:Uncharacterized protein n=1 Tax=Marchantia polymorpha subsp. ruderalis TaxID=1480154 RepID=A0A176VE84_MARPO|nr:hypothetical protein AXG93_2396s1350 [Marchantia polymorpha subsp. ruderalis]
MQALNSLAIKFLETVSRTGASAYVFEPQEKPEILLTLKSQRPEHACKQRSGVDISSSNCGARTRYHSNLYASRLMPHGFEATSQHWSAVPALPCIVSACDQNSSDQGIMLLHLHSNRWNDHKTQLYKKLRAPVISQIKSQQSLLRQEHKDDAEKKDFEMYQVNGDQPTVSHGQGLHHLIVRDGGVCTLWNMGKAAVREFWERFEGGETSTRDHSPQSLRGEKGQ